MSGSDLHYPCYHWYPGASCLLSTSLPKTTFSCSIRNVYQTKLQLVNLHFELFLQVWRTHFCVFSFYFSKTVFVVALFQNLNWDSWWSQWFGITQVTLLLLKSAYSPPYGKTTVRFSKLSGWLVHLKVRNSICFSFIHFSFKKNLFREFCVCHVVVEQFRALKSSSGSTFYRAA